MALTVPEESKSRKAPSGGSIFSFAAAAAVVALAGATLSGCRESSGTKKPGDDEAWRQRIPVRVEKLRKRPYRREVSSVATLEAWRRVTLRAEAPGKVTELGPDVGEEVAAEKLLVKVDSSTAWQAYRTAKVRIKQARVRLALAKKTMDRMTRLRRTGDVSVAQYDQAKNGYDAAKASLALAEAQTSQSRQSLSQYRIVAPFAGVLAERSVELGDYVSPGAATFTLVEMDRLKVVVGLEPGDASLLEPGDEARVIVTSGLGGRGGKEGADSRIHPAKVHLIRPVADTTTRRVEVELEIANPKRALRPGTVARVMVPLGEKQQKLMVPLDSIIERMGRKYVYVVHGGEARRVEVEQGVVSRNRVEVAPKSGKGLRPGDAVVVTGVERLIPGAPVAVATPVVREDEDDRKRAQRPQHPVVGERE